MDRPVTSKSRGICRYYTTPRGCFAGKECKFLHGETEQLTPYDKSKSCKFYAKGYCRHGDKCWFMHTPQPSSSAERDSASADADICCCICLEKPKTYGLLIGCSHIFCIQCIRQWRDPVGKSEDVVISGNTKKCPLCRTASSFITPSSRFFPQDHPGKTEVVEKYKASMARVPCRYFQETKSRDPLCPFGSDCFYQHQNDDGSPYIFPAGVEQFIELYKRRHRTNAPHGSRRTGRFARQLNLLSRIFGNPLDDLSATIDAIRATIPALVNHANAWDDGDDADDGYHDEEDDDADRGANEWTEADRIGTIERLADRMLINLAAWQDFETNGNGAGDGNPGNDGEDEMPSLESVYSDDDADPLYSASANSSAISLRALTRGVWADEPSATAADSRPDVFGRHSSSPLLNPLPVEGQPSSEDVASHDFPSVVNNESPRTESAFAGLSVPLSRFSTVMSGRMVIDIDENEVQGESTEEGDEDRDDDGDESRDWSASPWSVQDDFGRLADYEALSRRTDEVLARSEVVLAESEAALAESERVCAASEDVLDQSDGAPAESERVPGESERIFSQLVSDPVLIEVGDAQRPAEVVSMAEGNISVTEPDADPPFVTDGRGRVVWSSTRPGRGVQGQNERNSTPVLRRAGGSDRHLKARRPGWEAPSSPPATVEITSLPGPDSGTGGAFMTDGRGRVIWTGGDERANDGAEVELRTRVDSSLGNI